MDAVPPGGPDGDAGQGQDGAAELHLAEVLRLMIDDLERTLLHICQTASAAAGLPSGSAVALVTDGQARVTACDDPRVRALEALQYRIGDGPGLFAIRTGAAVRSDSLLEDAKWHRFGSRARHLGIHSVMAVPMAMSGRLIGALTCYARTRAAFDEATLRRLVLLAEPAAAIAHGADALVDRQRRVDQLTEALQVRPMIDQAVGIIRANTGKSEPEAMRWLRQRSNVEHVKVSTLAGQLVDEAVRRAHQRAPHERPDMR